MIRGEITYHDTGPSVVEGLPFNPIRLTGVVDPTIITAPDCEAAAEIFLGAAQFQGTYRSQDRTLSKLPGRFTVLVFDQGEPGRTDDPAFVTGDGFAIDLKGGSVHPLHPGWVHRGRQHSGEHTASYGSSG